MSERIAEELQRVKGIDAKRLELEEILHDIAAKGAALNIVGLFDHMYEALRYPHNHANEHEILSLYPNTSSRKGVAEKEYDSLQRRIGRWRREDLGGDRALISALLIHRTDALLFLLNDQYCDLQNRRLRVSKHNSIRMIDYVTLLELHKAKYRFCTR